MSNLVLNGHTVITQTGTNPPVIAGNVRFPVGHPIQYLIFGNSHNGQNTDSPYYYYGSNSGQTSATGTPIGQITLKQSNAKLMVVWTGILATGSHGTNDENYLFSWIRYSTNNDLSNSTEKQCFYYYQDTRAEGDLPQQTIGTKSGRILLELTNNANDTYYFGIKDTKITWNAGWRGDYAEGSVLEIIEVQK